MPTSKNRQREPIFDVNSVLFFIRFIAIFPLYIYTEFCNVHPRVTASAALAAFIMRDKLINILRWLRH